MLVVLTGAGLTATGIKLSYHHLWWTWLAGQFIFALGAAVWLHLLCRFARGEVFHPPWLNSIGGHLSSLLCLVPYNQFRYMNAVGIGKAEPIKQKLFPPLNVISWSSKNFWNIKRLFGLFQERHIRMQFIKSILMMNLFFLVLTPSIPGFWKTFGLGYFIYLVLVELLLTRNKLNISTKV